jgi:hypothetical protein
MSLKLDTTSAKQADSIASGIRETGKYVGAITRAEKLKSRQGTEGLGISFKTDSGQSADYLDIYTTKANGEALMGAKTVNAILACLRLREVNDGKIHCEKWNKNAGKRETIEVDGYPELMGKRIGFLLQKELGTNQETQADTEKMTIFGVFSAETELTASEILSGKTSPARLPEMVTALMARPVRDNRDRVITKPAATAAAVKPGFAGMDDDIPF